MITGTTKSGFEFQLSDHVFEDYETHEAITKYIRKRTFENLMELEEKIFSDSAECRKNARAFLRKDKGYFTPTDMDRLIGEIYTAAAEGKNS